ncbi:MAG: hypothetical protein CL526_07745 [Aequorivita sp.]|nr:hypothetical protein [Aequorivita sp.]|tara:strand:+ start:11725 stop:12936 length:1212 start_codon:yes stop_codon:yes gene_type:complete
MKGNRSSFFDFNLYLAFFLAFSGYYVVLMLVSNYGSTSLSRYFTIPIRLILLISFFYFFKKTGKKQNNRALRAFLVFSGFYLLRIFYEIIFGTSEFYMSKLEFLLYFVSFVLLPFYFISKIKFNPADYNKIFKTVIASCFFLSLFTYLFYRDLLGSVSRISMEISKDENYISPLALSYCASLGIGIGVAYLLSNKTSSSIKMLILLVIISCMVPFFLGASRGSLLALAIPFLFYFLFSQGIKRKFQIIFSLLLGIVTMLYATNFLGTGVFDRFFMISEAIDQGSSSAIRLQIWKSDLNQFLNHPFFGNSLESEFALHYPHNIFIEILITTGVLGFIPFSLFLILILKKSVKIVKIYPRYFWLFVVFMQSFVQYLFSGAIWNASWLAIGSALILGFDNFNKKDK